MSVLTSTACDKREHGDCDGTCVYMEQDGPNRYLCDCLCHAKVRAAQREQEALGRVRRFLREQGLDRRFEVVEKAPANDRTDAPDSGQA